MRLLIVVVLLLFISPYFAVGHGNRDGDPQESYQLSIVRTSEQVVVDGVLDEDIWQNAQRISDFWMSFPIDDRMAEPNVQTEVQMTYDDEFIYVAAVCKGPSPYIVQSLRRDNPQFFRGDAFAIVLDPVNQRTNGFVFGTNPNGVQTESLITGQTGTRGSNSSGLNRAWDNKWYTEVTKHEDHWVAEMAIPFKSLRYGNKRIWGINFVRADMSNNSYHSWSPVPVQFRSVDLGFTGALVWDETPLKSNSNVSVVPYLLGSGSENRDANESWGQEGQVGMDAKVAVSSGMNLDLTVNPDFSQVEVDVQVTNLTTFNIRFPERRLFFLENSDVFSDFGIPPIRPFFSRRIGLDEQGNTLPILFGARLSGNVNKDLRLGLMTMQTGETTSPGNNYTSFAMHQRIFGRTVVKGYFHNRQGFVGGEMANENYNRIGGGQASFQSMDGKWRAFTGYGLSQTEGLTDENYFFNIGTGYAGREFGFYANYAEVGHDYRADMGFLPRQEHYDAEADTSYLIGFTHFFGRINYNIYPDNPRINQHTFRANIVNNFTVFGDFIQTIVTAGYELSFSNTSQLTIEGSHQDAGLLYPFSFTSDSEPLPTDRYRFNFGGIRYRTDRRRIIFAEFGTEYGGFYNGTRIQYRAEVNYRIQPWGNFAMNFVRNDLDFPDAYGDVRLLLIGPRAEINFTRNIFWTTFFQYNTQTDNFNINSRLQWRYKPMSDFFLVYTDNYFVESWGPKNRAIVLKLNYWLNL